MLVLGLETSCDETSVALVDTGYAVRANIVLSQQEHGRYGGVVPELASRAHLRTIVPVLRQALETAGVELPQVEGVAVTKGPGLAGSLIVGLSMAKALALGLDKPLIGVHHLEGHIFSNLLERAISAPFLTLLVSGGHTELVLVRQLGQYQVLGRTRDDAAGEAFDKVAKLLGLLPAQGAVMGGRLVSELADRGDPQAISFPRYMGQEGDLDFSFSGLKTAVLNHVRALSPEGLSQQRPDIAASFQEAVVEVLVAKAIRAMERSGARQVALAGGVAANRCLREQLRQAVEEQGGRFCSPSTVLCTDNAAMIAAAGLYHLSQGARDGYDLGVFPRLSL